MTTHHYATIEGHRIFYREAGPANAPAIVLLHGFPSSSHMFRDLVPKPAAGFRVIAPDYLGFGYSDQPGAKVYPYTFDNLAGLIEKLLFEELRLKKFAIYVQDYGAPVGFRIASRHPDAISGIVVQNGNAYVEGISPAFEPLKPFWANRTTDTEQPVRALLTAEATRFQYTHGASTPDKISPDSWIFDQHFLERPGNDAIHVDLAQTVRHSRKQPVEVANRAHIRYNPECPFADDRYGLIKRFAILAGVAKFAAIGDTTEALYDEIFDINVKGTFFTVKKSLPYQADGAAILLNTSFVDRTGLPASSVYAASKATLRSFVRVAAAELVAQGIRVNAVSPGPTATPIFGKLGQNKGV